MDMTVEREEVVDRDQALGEGLSEVSYQLLTFKLGKRELRARRFSDEQEVISLIEHRKWGVGGWSEWRSFELIPYSDPFFCAVVKHLHEVEGGRELKILLPFSADRYQQVEAKRCQF